MSWRENANYTAFIRSFRVQALNDDLTLPAIDNLIAGAGPFDFSGVDSPTAVPFTVKIDGIEDSNDLDVDTGSVSLSAVTVDELVTLLTAAAFTDMTFSKDTTTGRLKAVAASGTYVQIYDEGFEISRFGQGYGLKFIKANTGESLSEEGVYKESETLTIQDSNGKETSVITDSYKKGLTLELVDTADDWELKALIEGGTLSADGNTYYDPDSETEKPYFWMEAFYAEYGRGDNLEADQVGYVQETFKKLSGQIGGQTHDRNINNHTYSLTGVNYKDASGVESGAKDSKKLTIPEYDALDVQNT